jgi:two-component system, cell cycle response regulator
MIGCTVENNPCRVLLFEDNPGDARLIYDMLKNSTKHWFALSSVNRLALGQQILQKQLFDIILLDLNLIDSQGIETFKAIIADYEHIPIIILSGLDDEETTIEAMHLGAQDYLVKDSTNTEVLLKSILYSIERMSLLKKIKEISCTDELTGLLNRRGFVGSSEKPLLIAKRNSRQMALIFADIDEMKLINDEYGHKAGDQAIIEAAGILKKTFRDSDIIARIGGDEFIVLVIEPDSENFSTLIQKRINDNLLELNSSSGRQFCLSISIGIVGCDSSAEFDLTDYIEKADKDMYKNKQKRRIII